MGNKGYRRYLKIEGEGHFAIDEAKLADDVHRGQESDVHQHAGEPMPEWQWDGGQLTSLISDNSSDLSRLSRLAGESRGPVPEELSIVNQSRAHDPLSFGHDRLQVLLVLEALGVDLVEVLGTGRAGREPAIPGHDL